MESQKSTDPVLGNDRRACYLTKLQARTNYELETQGGRNEDSDSLMRGR